MASRRSGRLRRRTPPCVAALLAAPQVAATGYRPPRSIARGVSIAHQSVHRQSRGRVCAGSDICGAEQRRARGRARERASSSDSPRLFERNDRREWSEFLGGPCDRAAQGTPRAARGCRIRAPAHTRPRLCALRPFKQPVMNSTIAQLEAFASALFKAAGMDSRQGDHAGAAARAHRCDGPAHARPRDGAAVPGRAGQGHDEPRAASPRS